MKPEEAWLLGCCRFVVMNQPVPLLSHEKAEMLDGKTLLLFAGSHRLVLLAYDYLIKPNHAVFPSATVEAFKQASQKIVHQQFEIIHKLFQIRESFALANVNHVFLKGPVLGGELFGNKLLRYSSDIDILIDPNHIVQADACLSALGYKPDMGVSDMLSYAADKHFFTPKDAVYRQDGLPMKVELHWKVVESPEYSSFYSWPDDVRFVDFQGQAFPVLADKLNVMYLCFHAAKHDWLKARWLVDILLYIEKKQIDLNDLLSLSRTHGFEPFVREALFLGFHWFGLEKLSIYREYTRAGFLLRRMTLRRSQKAGNNYQRFMLSVYRASLLYPKKSQLFKFLLFIFLKLVRAKK